MPAMEADAFAAGAPGIEMGGGEFFSQELGTLLRMRYNTESYGQERRGNLDIGTMRIANFQDAIAFFDGQATLSDVNGVGYNLGVGFRWLGWTPFPLEPERITGFSFWADGSSTESGNFFPQVGVSYESLGDMWDLRVNGYIPVGKDSQLGEFSPTGAVSFDENFLVQEALADRNTSFNVGEAEIARRIMADRDAWAFAGPYVLANDEQDAAGYRVGMRGYAYPDLLLQIAVTDDDIFKTNATFSVTWFVGRTRNDFQPAYGLADRMREPVMRNDYVALQRTVEVGGEPLTDTAGDAFRFVHVNSEAPDGGNGTFESPLNDVGEVQPNSQDSDIVLLYSNSVFTAQNTLALQDNQRLLGEGNGEFFTINTLQQGTVVIPETSPGARDGARSIIMGALGLGAVRLADTNEVANFNIDGTGSGMNVAGIYSPALGAGNPNIHDIDMRDVTGTGIQFTPLVRENENNAALKTVAGNVTIDDVNFDDMGDVEIDIDSATAEDVTNPNVTLQETILITDVDSQNGSDIGIWLRNTHAQRTATITNYTNGTNGAIGSGGGDAATGVLRFEGDDVDDFDGNVLLTNIDIFENEGYAIDYLNASSTSTTTVAATNGITWDGGGGISGGMRFDNFNGSFGGNSSTFTDGTLSALRVEGTSDGTINLASTVTFDSNDPIAGEAVINVGPEVGDSFTGALTVAGNITNHDTGRLVSIQRVSGAGTTVTLNGDMTDVANAGSTGILVSNNTGGVILFGGDLDIDTTMTNGITVTNNTGSDISFAGEVDIITDGINATAFQAGGGGTLTVSGTANNITTNGSSGVDIQDMTISTGGVRFESVDVTGGVNGILLSDNTGGPIVIGTLADPVGDGGEITGTTGEAIVVENSENVTLNSIRVTATAGQTGVRITKTSDTPVQVTNLNNLEINGGTRGIDVIGDSSGELDLTVNDTNVNGSTAFGMSVFDIDTGSITVNNTVLDGNNAAVGAVGVRILNSNATYLFDETQATDNTIIREWGSTDFLVDGGTPNINFNGAIINSSTQNPLDTTGRSVVIQNTTGGNKVFTSVSSITDDNEGMLVQNNGGGTISFLGTNNFQMATGTTAVRLDNNDQGTNVNMTLAGLTITGAGTAEGVVAINGGTLNVTGANNTINTDNGIGLRLEDMTIGLVDFQTVTVDGGAAATGILLRNLTGGQVEVGTAAGAQNSGGVLNTTSDAIIIENVQSVALHDMQITGSARGVAVTHSSTGTTAMDVTIDGLNLDASTGNGVEVTADSDSNTFIMRLTGGATGSQRSDLEENVVVNATGGALFQMRVQNTDINVTGATDAFATSISGGVQNVDMIISNSTFDADTGSAVSLVTSGGTGKTYDLLVENSTFENSSAANPAAEFLSSGNTTYNATIRGNTFDNGAGGGSDYTMTATGAQARMRLNLGGEDAAEMNNAIGQGVFNLIEDAGADFDVFELTETFANNFNNGTVAPQSPAGVANPGAFQDLPVAPVVPVIP